MGERAGEQHHGGSLERPCDFGARVVAREAKFRDAPGPRQSRLCLCLSLPACLSPGPRDVGGGEDKSTALQRRDGVSIECRAMSGPYDNGKAAPGGPVKLITTFGSECSKKVKRRERALRPPSEVVRHGGPWEGPR
jgi:hypothetical protein